MIEYKTLAEVERRLKNATVSDQFVIFSPANASPTAESLETTNPPFFFSTWNYQTGTEFSFTKLVSAVETPYKVFLTFQHAQIFHHLEIQLQPRPEANFKRNVHTSSGAQQTSASSSWLRSPSPPWPPSCNESARRCISAGPSQSGQCWKLRGRH